MDLNQDVRFLPGVGEQRAKKLNKLGIATINDLIFYFPRGYDDRTKIKKMEEIQEDEKAIVEAELIKSVHSRNFGRFKSIQKTVISDGTDKAIVTWFNQNYIISNFSMDQKYRFYGKFSRKNGGLELTSPIYELADKNQNFGKIVPVYPLTESLKGNFVRNLVEKILEEVNFDEILPEYLVKENSLMDYNAAINKIHFPKNDEEIKAARNRLIFDEFLETQIAMLKFKNDIKSLNKGIMYEKVDIDELIKSLPFELTNAQKKVVDHILEDMESEKQMNRLLQGDVGSGKTIVSIISAYKAVKSGYQVAFLAPTMILAKQHYKNFCNILEKFNVKIDLLVGGTTKKNKEQILSKIKDGSTDILIGTHAILEEDVVFKNLGFVVTDEQHRFGVKQRENLLKKGLNPDVLVMSATPIPRTLALIVYGDLDISIIDELPKNRQTIETYVVDESYNERLYKFIREEVKKGRQVYIVCPLVEEKKAEIKVDEKTGECYIELEKVDNLKSVEEIYKIYSEEIFSDLRVGYLHGKMKQKEKDEIMQEFKDGNMDIIVSTTVIEVGVDVPNASLMIIENSERFGLAQLHQLRGRVGRGSEKSYCILKYASKSEKIKKRLDLIRKTNNGFIIAEKDLELRGSGDFFGTKQHGIPEFKIGNVYENIDILEKTQEIVKKIFEDDPYLEKEKNKKLLELSERKIKLQADLVI